MNPGDHKRELHDILYGAYREFWEFTNSMCNQPNIDVLETNKATLIYAEVPGLAKEDLSIQAEGNHLSISGEFKKPKIPADAYFRRMERCFGKFTRTIPLEQAVKDAGGVTAKLENGILEVNIPRSEPNIFKVPIN